MPPFSLLFSPETYIKSTPALRLLTAWRPCRIDDEIFEHAMKEFPELAEDDHAKVTKLDEDWMKSESGKKRWHDFIAS